MNIFAPNLQKMRERKDVAGLIKALHGEKALFADDHKLKAIQDGAAKILAEIGSPAVQPLIDSLGDENSKVRELAADALGKIGDPRAVDSLCAALGDPEYRVKVNAACALGKIHDPRAMEPLVNAMSNMEGYRVESYASALVEFGAAGIEALLMLLREGKAASARVMAASKLGEIVYECEVKVLRGFRDDSNKFADFVEPLIGALKDSDKKVTTSAVKALYMFKSKSAQAENAINAWHKEEFTGYVPEQHKTIRLLAFDLLFGDHETCRLAVSKLGGLYDEDARKAIETIMETFKKYGDDDTRLWLALDDFEKFTKFDLAAQHVLRSVGPGIVLLEMTKAVVSGRNYLLR